MKKKLIPCLYLQSEKAVTGFGQRNLLGDGDVEKLASFTAITAVMNCWYLTSPLRTKSMTKPSARSATFVQLLKFR